MFNLSNFFQQLILRKSTTFTGAPSKNAADTPQPFASIRFAIRLHFLRRSSFPFTFFVLGIRIRRLGRCHLVCRFHSVRECCGDGICCIAYSLALVLPT